MIRLGGGRDADELVEAGCSRPSRRVGQSTDHKAKAGPAGKASLEADDGGRKYGGIEDGHTMRSAGARAAGAVVVNDIMGIASAAGSDRRSFC